MGKSISISKHPCFVWLKFRPLPTRLPHQSPTQKGVNCLHRRRHGFVGHGLALGSSSAIAQYNVTAIYGQISTPPSSRPDRDLVFSRGPPLGTPIYPQLLLPPPQPPYPPISPLNPLFPLSSPFYLSQCISFWPKTPLEINFLAILSIERQVYMQKYNFFVKQIFF